MLHRRKHRADAFLIASLPPPTASVPDVVTSSRTTDLLADGARDQCLQPIQCFTHTRAILVSWGAVGKG